MTNLHKLDLNLLRVLDAVLQYGSTVRAGEKLGLSQPAVSAALGRLRATLDDELFVRRGQGLQPTDFAISLRVPLRQNLESIEAMLLHREDFDPINCSDNFKISGSDYFAELLMPPLATLLSRQAPNMKVNLVNLVPDHRPDTIEQFGVDMALMPQVDLPDWLDSQFVLYGIFTIIARHGHPRLIEANVQPGDRLPLDLFCDLDHILFSPEGKSVGVGDEALAVIGRSRRVVMTLPSFSGICRSVAGSDLIALMPIVYANQVAKQLSLNLYAIPPQMSVQPVRLEIVWPRRSTANPAHMWLRKQIRELMTADNLA
ncbi:MAG: LysR family transcriptional regulator [Rhizobiaceae bacterium]